MNLSTDFLFLISFAHILTIPAVLLQSQMSSQEALLRYLYCIPASDCPQHLPLTAGSHFHTIIIKSTTTQYVLQSNIINKPTLNRHSNRHFYVSEKKSPKELLSPQIIFFFIEGSPVDDPTVLQNRSTMGVQIPSTFPKSLDFKPFQPKVRFLGKL